MATNRTFQSMLNEYLTYDLLKEELIKRDWLLGNCGIDEGWKGGTLPVPFRGSGSNSIAFGALTADNDIAEDIYVRGEVTDYKELWGSLLFNQRDLWEHDGRVKEKSFLRVLPDIVDDFMMYMKYAASTNLLIGAAFDRANANGTVGAGIEVRRVERFNIGQKVEIVDNDTAGVSGYVRTIDQNTNIITLFNQRTGGSILDLSAFTTAQDARFYHPGGQTTAFVSLKESLLSAANGGTATLYGQTKTAYPYLQAINVDGSSITAANILDKLFDAYTTHRQKGKGDPQNLVMSFKNLGSVMKALELYKGQFDVVPNSRKASPYGWTSIEIFSGAGKGSLQLIGVQEMDDDVIFGLDMKAMKFHSNGMFRKRVAPDGKSYFEIRATTGYQYIVDVALYGELVVSRPSYCFVVHTISY